MTGKESGHIDHSAAQAVPHINPDALEVAPGTAHENLEGWIPQLATDDEIRVALEKAFDYRGDVTITRKDGSRIEGYLFDRRTAATLKDSVVRLYPKNSNEKISISYADIAALAFTGRDTAAGKSWEAWMKKYAAKKAAGETNIALEPEPLTRLPTSRARVQRYRIDCHPERSMIVRRTVMRSRRTPRTRAAQSAFKGFPRRATSPFSLSPQSSAPRPTPPPHPPSPQ